MKIAMKKKMMMTIILKWSVLIINYGVTTTFWVNPVKYFPI